MTLFRQIAALVSVIFLLILVGVVWNDIHHARSSLEGQMQTLARDMATTLGIAIANSEEGADPVSLETFFNAVFDSGYFASIALHDPSGVLVYGKSQPLTIEGVPEWFIEAVRFEPPVGQAPVSKGWVQLGTLEVTLHPGYVYSGLYDGLKSVLTWLLVIAIGGLVLLWWLLHLVLQPLRRVREQADAIHENRFLHQSELPRTLELRRVVQAMNRMVDKVKRILSEQSAELNRYHELLYRDETTGLANRRAVMAKLDEVQGEEVAHGGRLVLIHLEGVEELAERHGYPIASDLLNALARAMEDALAGRGDDLAGRMKKFEFALYLARDAASVEQCVREIFRAFGDARMDVPEPASIHLSAGVAALASGKTPGKALSEADFALTRAKALGDDAFVHDAEREDDLPEGRMQWRHYIESCIEQDRVVLMTQAVENRDARVEHREVFVRLRDESGRLVQAGLFMPMATDLRLDQEIDLQVLKLLKRDLTDASPKYAVNLGQTFLTDPSALARVEEALRTDDLRDGNRFQIECRHFLLHNHPELAEVLFSRLRSCVGAVGIDNLDLSLPLDLLQTLRPDYVKTSAKLLAEIASEQGPGALRGLFTLAHSLEIRLIALGVETPELKQSMLELGIDWLQGNHIARAEEHQT